MDRMDADNVLRPRAADHIERRVAVYVAREAYVVMVHKYTTTGRVWTCEHPVDARLQGRIDAVRQSFVLVREPIPGNTEYLFVKPGEARPRESAMAGGRASARAAAASADRKLGSPAAG